MQDVAGKVAVITGAGSGIGRGMAEAFVDAKMKVILSDIERGPLEETAKSLAAAGGDVRAVVTDVSNHEQVQALSQEALKTYGAVHVLCNNAGVGVASHPSWKSTLDDWQWILGVNLMGVVHGIRTFLPIMLRQGVDAHIVNTASLAAFIPGENALYATTKAAVVALSESLYLELKRSKSKTTISVLCPAFVKSNILSSGRNRPKSLADVGPPAAGPFANVALDWVKNQVDNGLDPRAVGDQVLSAVKAERFYIFTHPDWKPVVEQRMQRILADENPTFPVQPPGSEILKAMVEEAIRAGKG
jgi:NAD(P)-dependent dehydrogenase (short-subunit alcohol dehydrogenase family)